MIETNPGLSSHHKTQVAHWSVFIASGLITALMLTSYIHKVYDFEFVSVDFNIAKAATAPELGVSPTTGTVANGGALTVNIYVDTFGSASDGVDVYSLRFNQNVLRVNDDNGSTSGVQITPGSLYPNVTSNVADNTAGTIRFSVATSGGSTFTGSGTLATIHFTAISGGTSTLNFDYTLNSTIDSNIAFQGNDILRGVVNGSYTVDATAPTVNVVSPGSGATVSGTTTINANASDATGVAGVQFKIDGANLGAEDTSSPYSTSWTTGSVGNGSHTITATARDNYGNNATSPGITVTVNNADTTAPTVSMTAPTSGATVSGTGTTVSANASDNLGVAGVQFKLDGSNLGTEDTSSPYSISWNTTGASNGSHSLTATARDAAGNNTTSSAVSVTVNNADTTVPTVSLTAPASGATVSGTATAVSATASDNVAVVGVQFKVDGANIGAEDTSSPYSVNWNTTTASNGSHTLTAVARDAAGNNATSAGRTVTVNNADTTVPTVSITAPAGGSTVSGTSTTVSANASDNIGVAGVQFKLDGSNLGAEDTSSPYSISWNTTTASNGGHTITATARDAAGNNATSSGISVTVNNAPPNQVPLGNLDQVTPGAQIRGWSFDPDSSSVSNQVAIYIDGPVGTGTLVSTVSANIDRPDIRSTYGISGNHGFQVNVPVVYQDGRYHSVYAYGIDLSSSSITALLGSAHNFTTRRISVNPEARNSNVVTGTITVMNNARTTLVTNSFTSDTSGLATIVIDLPSQTVLFKIQVPLFLSRVVAGVDLSTTTLNVSIPTLQIGDINGDNIINSTDYSVLNSHWFQADANSDFNQDGIVNAIDFSFMNQHWLIPGEQ